jgi:hypothetical protein
MIIRMNNTQIKICVVVLMFCNFYVIKLLENEDEQCPDQNLRSLVTVGCSK